MKSFVLIVVLATLATAAWGQNCVVSDPSGTPLNVRSHPNGPILGALHNGVTVRILDTTFDDRGRPWAYVAPLDAGRRGWVFRNYLDCE